MFNIQKKTESKAVTDARAEYEDALKLVSNLCQIRFPTDFEKKYEKMSRNFEEMVQGILLITAIEDNSLCEEEWSFLESFSSHVSILDHLNNEIVRNGGKKQKLTFKKLQHIDDATREELNQLVRSILEAAATGFYQTFAEIDYIITEVDYIHEFKLHIIEMVRLLSTVDGDDSKDERAIGEKSAGLKAFFDIIEKYWKSYGAQDKAWRYAIGSSQNRNFIDRAEDQENDRLIHK